MPPHDSDSSDEGDQDYSTTNVTLGYATATSTGDDISHIGGHPTWLDPSVTPPAAFAKCKVCNSYMSLLLQLNADLQTYFPDDERRLHVYCCRKKQCSKKVGSVRAFREIRKPAARMRKEDKKPPVTQSESVKATQDLGSALFGSSGQSTTLANSTNPFSMSFSSAQSTINPFASITSPSTLAALPPQTPISSPPSELPTQSFADKLKISIAGEKPTAPPQQDPWPSASSFPSPFPFFHLDAYPEELDNTPTHPPPANESSSSSRTKYDAEDSTAGKEDFESSMDKTFQKFSDRVAQNPEQVLRYEFKGDPLLYSEADDVASRFVTPHGKPGAAKGMPRCDGCGGQRVFEVQLMPGLIFEVEKDEDLGFEEGMEWGTIVVGSCLRNCGEDGTVTFREEWVGVQWEEGVVRK